MKRESRQLDEQEFDLLIIGSGIYGACLAREAAMRGLRVALIDKGDFGASTSANSLKVIHGGLRYLQHFNWVRMRESIRARRQLLSIAPYLVRPRSFIVPTYGFGMKSKWIMRVALLLNDLISLDRNRALSARHKIAAGKVLSRQQCLDIMPGVNKEGLTGAAQWQDGFVENTERLMMALVHSATQKGVVAVNYVQADHFVKNGNRITGVRAHDCLDGHSLDIKARMVINAAGPGAASLGAGLASPHAAAGKAWVKAFNLFIRRPLFDHAVGLSSTVKHIDRDAVINKGSRFYFFVPWKNGTLIGTDYVTVAPGDDACLTRTERDGIIREINALYPDANIHADEIGFCHVGLLPANSTDPEIDAAARLLKHTRVINHAAESGIQGLFTVVGIKYTVAPQVAIGVIDEVLKSMNIHASRPAAEPPLYGAESSGPSPGSESEARLFDRYGCHYTDVLDQPANLSGLRREVGAGVYTIKAEVIHAVREEMAVSLSDVVYRRTELGSTGVPERETLRACADIMATELAWDKHRIDAEVRAAEQVGLC